MEQSLAQRITTLHSELNSKNTFLNASTSLCLLLKHNFAVCDAATKDLFYKAVARVASLLRSRYTAIQYWSHGSNVINEALAVMTDSKQVSELKKWKAMCDDHIEHANEEEKAELKAAADAAANPAAGIDGVPSLDSAANVAESLLGPDASVFLQSIMGAFSDPGMFENSGPPPASRDARFNIPVITVDTHEKETCAICQEAFPINSKAKQLPCQHLFHFDCILPWLEQHNSCPTCRSSLPSEKLYFDDIADKIKKRDAAHSGLYN
eukprot:GILJ01001761.1.p1 GENE.GILJ01001761.1~~GILJ01001761.1.p1  ORF type:complete len:298 (-),score=34.81 GILJ01001761.1:233-1030(-)